MANNEARASNELGLALGGQRWVEQDTAIGKVARLDLTFYTEANLANLRQALSANEIHSQIVKSDDISMIEVPITNQTGKLTDSGKNLDALRLQAEMNLVNGNNGLHEPRNSSTSRYLNNSENINVARANLFNRHGVNAEVVNLESATKLVTEHGDVLQSAKVAIENLNESNKVKALSQYGVPIKYELNKLDQPDFIHGKVGHADPRLLGGIAASTTAGLLAKGAVAAVTHAMPAGVETGFQQYAANEVMEKAERDKGNKKLTPEQYDIIKSSTEQAVKTATVASQIPADPGVGSDKAVQLADKAMVEKLVKTGMSPEKAAQYEMGSVIGVTEKLAEISQKNANNITAVNRAMQQDGKVPLSTALNITQAELQWLGAKSETLSDKLLKTEVARDDRFKAISHLPEKDIAQLAKLSNAGIDPYVKVDAQNGQISTVSQVPKKLANEPAVAYQQAAQYILVSGDTEYRAPRTAPKEVQATVAAYANLYKNLSADGGLSKQDYQALDMSAHKVISEIASNSENVKQMVSDWQKQQQKQVAQVQAAQEQTTSAQHERVAGPSMG